MASEQPSGEGALALERQVGCALSVAARNVVAVYRPWLEPIGPTHRSTSSCWRSGSTVRWR